MSKGLPGRLPAGERILWQGSPSARALLRSMFHIRALAAYFALIIAWCAASSLRSGYGMEATAITASRMIGVASVPLVLILVYAWLLQRTTIYTITTKRIVLHHGVAFPMSINLPFARIGAASLTTAAGGAGDIPVALTEGSKIAYLAVWPNARPWRMRNPPADAARRQRRPVRRTDPLARPVRISGNARPHQGGCAAALRCYGGPPGRRGGLKASVPCQGNTPPARPIFRETPCWWLRELCAPSSSPPSPPIVTAPAPCSPPAPASPNAPCASRTVPTAPSSSSTPPPAKPSRS